MCPWLCLTPVVLVQDLSEYHASMIDRVLRFTRMKRGASVKEVSLVFGDVKDDR